MKLVVLTSKAVQASIASILESLMRADVDEAKRKIQALLPEAKTERERGSIMAAAGICASMSKAKGGAMQTWDSARVERAARSIVSSQMADDFDAGYADTLLNYARLTAGTQRPAA
jgi:type IV secretory pathway TrbL component